MNQQLTLTLGLLLPLVGTTLGSGMVFFLKKDMQPLLQKALLGFAAGVMIAASVWSLLIPAMEMSGEGPLSFLPACIGFLGGMGFLLLLDTLIPHLHLGSDCPEGTSCGVSKSFMLIFAVALHNLPEGMAVGVVLAGVLSGSQSMTLASALALSLGIAIQNFPEGAIISMPLVKTGISRRRAFAFGFASGVVEPLGALLMILLTSQLSAALPYVLAFAAGAMIYVVVEELIPESQAEPHSNLATIACALGFALMMVLDVALG